MQLTDIKVDGQPILFRIFVHHPVTVPGLQIPDVVPACGTIHASYWEGQGLQ